MDSLLLPPPASPHPSQNVALAVLLIAGRTCKMNLIPHISCFFLFSNWSNATQGIRKDRILVYPCVASLVACGDPFTIVRNCATQRTATQRSALRSIVNYGKIKLPYSYATPCYDNNKQNKTKKQTNKQKEYK